MKENTTFICCDLDTIDIYDFPTETEFKVSLDNKYQIEKNLAFNIAYGTDVFVNRYLIKNIIAQGGEGVVYQAHDLQNDSTVAIKLFCQMVKEEDSKFNKRITKEWQIMKKLNHQNIIPYKDTGCIKSEEGYHYYFVYPLVKGETLYSLKENSESLSVEQVLRIAYFLADTVDFIHSKGIVHNDLNLKNVIVFEKIFLIDFGLAEYAKDYDITDATKASGTIAYMSPQQLNGNMYDPKNDVWAVGVILYELLTGEKPFVAKNKGKLMDLIFNSKPNGFPEHLQKAEKVVFSMLAQDPNDRPQNLKECILDLVKAYQINLNYEKIVFDHNVRSWSIDKLSNLLKKEKKYEYYIERAGLLIEKSEFGPAFNDFREGLILINKFNEFGNNDKEIFNLFYHKIFILFSEKSKKLEKVLLDFMKESKNYDPKNLILAYYFLGDILSKKEEQIKSASKYYLQALTLDEDKKVLPISNPKRLENIVKVLLSEATTKIKAHSEDLLEIGLEILNIANELKNNHLPTLLKLSIVNFKLQKYNDFQDNVKEILTFELSKENEYFCKKYLTISYFLAGKTEKAKKMFSVLKKHSLAKNDIGLYVCNGINHYLLGEFEESLAELLRYVTYCRKINTYFKNDASKVHPDYFTEDSFKNVKKLMPVNEIVYGFSPQLSFIIGDILYARKDYLWSLFFFLKAYYEKDLALQKNQYWYLYDNKTKKDSYWLEDDLEFNVFTKKVIENYHPINIYSRLCDLYNIIDQLENKNDIFKILEKHKLYNYFKINNSEDFKKSAENFKKSYDHLYDNYPYIVDKVDKMVKPNKGVDIEKYDFEKYFLVEKDKIKKEYNKEYKKEYIKGAITDLMLSSAIGSKLSLNIFIYSLRIILFPIFLYFLFLKPKYIRLFKKICINNFLNNYNSLTPNDFVIDSEQEAVFYVKEKEKNIFLKDVSTETVSLKAEAYSKKVLGNTKGVFINNNNTLGENIFISIMLDCLKQEKLVSDSNDFGFFEPTKSKSLLKYFYADYAGALEEIEKIPFKSKEQKLFKFYLSLLANSKNIHKSKEYYFNAFYYYKQKNNKEALTNIDLALNTKDYEFANEAWYLKAKIFFDENKVEKAVECYKKCIENNYKLRSCYFNLINIYRNNNDQENGKKIVLEYLDLYLTVISELLKTKDKITYSYEDVFYYSEFDEFTLDFSIDKVSYFDIAYWVQKFDYTPLSAYLLETIFNKPEKEYLKNVYGKRNRTMEKDIQLLFCFSVFNQIDKKYLEINEIKKFVKKQRSLAKNIHFTYFDYIYFLNEKDNAKDMNLSDIKTKTYFVEKHYLNFIFDQVLDLAGMIGSIEIIKQIEEYRFNIDVFLDKKFNDSKSIVDFRKFFRKTASQYKKNKQ